jgi:cytochrome c biogenesis protein CcmG, thiol:disulfide interchange protein DsbE
MRFVKFLLPLALFVLLAVLLARGLNLNPREVPSPLIDKAAPPFSLPLLGQPGQTLAHEQMRGQVWVLNVWASWCVPCRAEHPLLMNLASRKLAPIVGLNYKDKTEAALTFLGQLGDPFVSTVVDADGRVGIDYGVYGVPETFVIDKRGLIRLKHIGPLTPEVIEQRIEPLLRELDGPG